MTYICIHVLVINLSSLKAVATGDALEALLSKMRGLLYLLCWSILQINSVGLYDVLSAWAKLFSFSIRKNLVFEP